MQIVVAQERLVIIIIFNNIYLKSNITQYSHQPEYVTLIGHMYIDKFTVFYRN